MLLFIGHVNNAHHDSKSNRMINGVPGSFSQLADAPVSLQVSGRIGRVARGSVARTSGMVSVSAAPSR
ncbi:hypothetical protein ACQP00_20780 [Dactylosporangium sp. CS-047395]|uniref:hypothetical protein n=1 Tax=Dactylosporangium sp. CS-047395 TaxID=3239936 RepID=UPI003D8A321A